MEIREHNRELRIVETNGKLTDLSRGRRFPLTILITIPTFPGCRVGHTLLWWWCVGADRPWLEDRGQNLVLGLSTKTGSCCGTPIPLILKRPPLNAVVIGWMCLLVVKNEKKNERGNYGTVLVLGRNGGASSFLFPLGPDPFSPGQPTLSSCYAKYDTARVTHLRERKP